MQNKTTIITVLVIVAIGVMVFFINKKSKLDDTQTPSPIINTQVDTPIVETSTQTEVIPITPTEPVNPEFPQTGYKPLKGI